MKKKNIFLYISLIVITIIGIFFFYGFARWYEQALGSIFAYIFMVSFVLLIFAPFKFMKDKKAKIGFVIYVKYFGFTLLYICKIVFNMLKEILLTISYMISKLLSKNKDKY